MTTQISVPEAFVARIRGQEFAVSPQDLPDHVLARVFEYGLQQMLNDSAASATDEDDAMAKAGARWDNMKAGVLRAAGNREGDPIKAEAKRIAQGLVAKAKVYIGWLQENGLKAGSKEGKAKLNELAAQLATRENILAQAKANVEAAKGLDIDIEI